MVTKGDTPVNITWHLNGKPTSEIKGITVTRIGHKSSSLSIDSVASIHNGVYTCSAANRAGHANYSTELAVNGIYTILTTILTTCIILIISCFVSQILILFPMFPYRCSSIKYNR